MYVDPFSVVMFWIEAYNFLPSLNLLLLDVCVAGGGEGGQKIEQKEKKKENSWTWTTVW